MSTMAPPIGTLQDLRGRQVLVLGLARSGVAAARMLVDAGALVTIYDRRPAAELGDSVASLGDRAVTLALEATPAAVRELLGKADLLVTSPSISPDVGTCRSRAGSTSLSGSSTSRFSPVASRASRRRSWPRVRWPSAVA